MALLKFGGGITEMRGSIAGNVYSRNRFGAYARPRTKPVNPQSAGQELCRSVISFLTEYWHSTLTAAERTSWETYAASVAMQNKLGETIYLTGFNHFVRSNFELKRQALTVVEAGPTVLSLPETDPTFAISASAATQNVSVTLDNGLPWANEDDAYMFVEMGVPQIVTRTFFNGPWNYMDKIDGDSVTPPSIPDAQTAPFTLVEGQKIWCYARIVRADGRLSNPFTASCVVAA